jgi:hypothetical protein
LCYSIYQELSVLLKTGGKRIPGNKSHALFYSIVQHSFPLPSFYFDLDDFKKQKPHMLMKVKHPG